MITNALLSVTVPALSRILTTRTTLKGALQITRDTDDAYLDLLISQASGAAETYCNRIFAQQKYREAIRIERDDYPYFVPGGLVQLPLSAYPVSTVTSVVEDGIPLTEGVDYEVDYPRGLLQRLDGTDRPLRWPALKIVVVYTAGYLLPSDPGRSLPVEIETAVIEIVKERYLSRLRDPQVRVVSAQGEGHVAYWQGNIRDRLAPGLSDQAAAVLDYWRRPTTP